MPRSEFDTGAVASGPARPAVAACRLASGGLSMLVAIALAVNLTCRAAGPVLESFRDRPTDRSTLRHLTLAIHRVVRRWMRQDVRPRGESFQSSHSRYGNPVRRPGRMSLGLAHACRLVLPAHLTDMPPPILA